MFKFIKLITILFIAILFMVGCQEDGNESEDSKVPSITIQGEISLTIREGSKYVDEGATALDDVDGEIEVEVSGSVDSSKVGIYIITYTATDKRGNKSTRKRTVKVIPKKIVDTTPPVITLNGSNSITIEQGTNYNDAGATATDNIDGIVEVTTKGSVNISTVGSYVISYRAVDKAGNKAEKTRKIKVISKKIVDTTPPVIILKGSNSVTIEQGVNYNDAGATATDNIDGAVKVTQKGNINSLTVGTYIITYNSVDKAGNSSTKQRTIKVIAKQITTLPPIKKDNNPPIITLKGSDFITIEQGTSYHDAGATATDDIDGVVKVTTKGNVESSKVGTYTISYSAIDKAKNKVTTIRTIKVVPKKIVDTTPPIITLKGSDFITIEQGTSYRDAGATATDNIDGVVKVTTKGSVDSSKANIYIITYSTVDKAGNSSIKERTINVTKRIVTTIPPVKKDTIPPLIKLNGDNLIIIELGISYIDAGATATDNVDGTVKVTKEGSVNSSKTGWYYILYSAVDKAGNRATVIKRTVKVIETKDTTPPVITLIGKDFIVMQQEFFASGKLSVKIKNNKIYSELGATAIDNIDGVVEVTRSGEVDSYKKGTYIITYSAVDRAGNKATKIRTVKVVYDNTPPVITLTGKNFIIMEQEVETVEKLNIKIKNHKIYTEPGVTARDNVDGMVEVTRSGEVNSYKKGTYIIIYSAVDRAGNKATKIRTVKVIYDNTPPEITLNGRNPMTLRVGMGYREAGATATDNRDKKIKVQISGDTVQVKRAGTYIIVYTATDLAKNTTTTTRTVRVRRVVSLKTEQTISYKAFDDGYYQKGQESDLIRDDEKEIIIDNITKLMWQDNIQTQSNKRKWTKEYCQRLTLGNYHDWKLPNKKELLSIVNYNKYSPSTYEIFEHIKSDFYWSSTINIHNKHSMWAVSFDDGSTTFHPKESRNALRCVRDNN